MAAQIDKTTPSGPRARAAPPGCMPKRRAVMLGVVTGRAVHKNGLCHRQHLRGDAEPVIEVASAGERHLDETWK
jgi:hypothetical protein